MASKLSGNLPLHTPRQFSVTPLLAQHWLCPRPPAAHLNKVWNSGAQESAKDRISVIEAS